MTLTVAINGTGVLSNAETKTNWNAITIGSEADEGDFYLQGSQCVSSKASNKAGELYYDCETDFTRDLDFDTAGTEEGQLLFMWIGCTTLGLLESIANNGLAIRLYNDSTHWADFLVAGNDDLRNFRNKKGGFVCFALDPTLTPTNTNISFDYGAISWIGVHIETTGLVKSENIMIDTIAVGYGIQVTASDTDGWNDMADYCTAYATRAWGMIQYDDSKRFIYSMGKILIGDSAQASPTSLTDTLQNIVFIQTEYYVAAAWQPMVPDSYMGYDFEDNTGVNFTTFTDGSLVGTDGGGEGSSLYGSPLVTTYFDTTGLTNADSVIELYNTKFLGIDSAVDFKNDADHLVYSCVFDSCAEVDFGGSGIVIRNVTFSNTAGTSAFLWYTDLDIETCRISNNSYGIRHTLSEEVDYITLLFADNTKDVYYTAATGDLDVNNIGTPRSDASTFDATGSGTVNFISAVTYTLTDLQANSSVLIIKQSDESIIDEVENSGTTYNYPYNYGGDIDVYVVVHHIDYTYIRFEDILQNGDKSTKVFQQADRWYSNP